MPNRPLQSEEAEMALLGAMMLSNRAVEAVAPILLPSDFYSYPNRLIFESILTLTAAKKDVDMVSINSELEAKGLSLAAGGVEYIIQVGEYVPSPANVETYAAEVIELAKLRALRKAGTRIIESVDDFGDESAQDRIETAERLVFDVAQRRDFSPFQPVKALVSDFLSEVDAILDGKADSRTISTGFLDLDASLGGFHAGELTILAARPSMGKTALAMDFLKAAATARRGPVAFFSLEMSKESITKRLFSTQMLFTGSDLSNGPILKANYDAVVDAAEKLTVLPIHVDDVSGRSPMDMRANCRRLVSEHGPLALVVIDYLQLIRGSQKTENRTQELGEIGRSLKAMAKEFNVPVIALSQLNRGVEARSNKRPLMSDIRESGSIEADADVVLTVYRESYYSDGLSDLKPGDVDIVEIGIAKNRNGETGTAYLGFQPHWVRFRNLTIDAKRQYDSQVRRGRSDKTP